MTLKTDQAKEKRIEELREEARILQEEARILEEDLFTNASQEFLNEFAECENCKTPLTPNNVNEECGEQVCGNCDCEI